MASKYRSSKFNPFANGGVDAGRRIKRSNGSNRPVEGDSDYRSGPTGNFESKSKPLPAKYTSRKKRVAK